MRCAKTRLMANSRMTPRATRICAAIATLTFLVRVAHTILMMQVACRAMQKPNSIADMMKVCPRLRLSWKIVMWAIAPQRKMNMKTEVMGTSRLVVGTPPTPAVVGG